MCSIICRVILVIITLTLPDYFSAEIAQHKSHFLWATISPVICVISKCPATARTKIIHQESGRTLTGNHDLILAQLPAVFRLRPNWSEKEHKFYFLHKLLRDQCRIKPQSWLARNTPIPPLLLMVIIKIKILVYSLHHSAQDCFLRAGQPRVVNYCKVLRETARDRDRDKG